MNARKLIPLTALLCLLLAPSVPAASQGGDTISIDGADEVSTVAVSPSQGLTNSLAVVGPRFVLQYANQLRYIELATVPASLQTLLAQVSDRFVLQYANANRLLRLSYPLALINDHALPVISALVASASSTGIATITWTTDEFATGSVSYGTQPGVYTATVSDPLYAKGHMLTLPGLTLGVTYYYQVTSTDLSGNSAVSSEYSFTAQTPTPTPEQGPVYVPLVRKR